MTDEQPEETTEEQRRREPIEVGLPTSGLVLDLGPKNVESEMRGKVQAALQQPLVPKDVEYVLITTIIPNSAGQPMPAFALTMAIKSPIVGEMIQATAILPTPWFPTEDVAKVVNQLAESLLTARSEQTELAVQQDQAKESVTGLINPNGRPLH